MFQRKKKKRKQRNTELLKLILFEHIDQTMNQKRLAALRVAKGYHILPIRPWMQLELHEHVGEGNNKRIWKFKWLVIKVKKPNHPDGSFTVRGKVAGQTVEKIYPLSFPKFDKVLVLDEYKVRRAKLYYIRDKVWKDARMKSILTNADKGVDLLTLALEEIKALQAAYDEAQPKEEVAQEEEQTEQAAEQQEETQEEQVQETEEAQQEETQE